MNCCLFVSVPPASCNLPLLLRHLISQDGTLGRGALQIIFSSEYNSVFVG